MNTITLAVAGARKTQSIVDSCAVSGSKRCLTITYTLTGQWELSRRLAAACEPGAVPDVVGWYSFLLRHMVRPFLPRRYPGRRLGGLNFEGTPALGRFATGESRFLDAQGRAYKLHLSKLALDVIESSGGSAIDRLGRLYDVIYIDEAQDLTGCDLKILLELMRSKIELKMVADVRQSVYDTNPQDPNLRQYRGVKMTDWFELQRKAGLLSIFHSTETWRSNQEIATFSDSIFSASFGFEPTVSRRISETGHDGIFVVSPDDVQVYRDRYNPVLLRDSKRTASEVDGPFQTFGKVKGITVDRVLIYPTRPIKDFLKSGANLAPKSACGLYVGVTRARHSVAFVVEATRGAEVPRWDPESG